MNSHITVVFMVLAILLFVQCRNEPIDDGDPNNIPLEDIDFPDKFDFSTTRIVELHLKAPDFLSGSVFEVWYKGHDLNNVFILKGTLDKTGNYYMKTSLPWTVDTLLVRPLTFGLETDVHLPI